MSTGNQGIDSKIKLGIAKCLLGEKVRYDGSQKLDRYLRDVLGQYVEWVPVCPEVECGMSIPREAVRLVGDLDSPRLVGRSSGKDWTDTMHEWGKGRLDRLAHEDICGYVFRFGSPSNGMNRVKVYQDGNRVRHDGTGMWARMVMEKFTDLPFEDDGRLHDPALRENFISRVFTLKRWRDAMSEGFTARALVEFHTCHKMLIMAHNEKIYRAMGKIVARAGTDVPELIFPEYFEMLFNALTYKLTVKKHINVLMHAFGYFKKDLNADEKQEMLELLDQFSKELIPLVAPVTLLNHYVRKYSKDYLAKQYYLNPYPAELMLRNHV